MSENRYFTTLSDLIKNRSITEIEAKTTASDLRAHQQITSEEYDLLMEMANELSPNNSDGVILSRVVALENSMAQVLAEIKAIKETIETGGTEVPEPEPGASGTKEDPIVASRGMVYYKDKYYKDPEDNNIYLCTRDSDSEPGSGIALAYLPHELVMHYFTLSE